MANTSATPRTPELGGDALLAQPLYDFVGANSAPGDRVLLELPDGTLHEVQLTQVRSVEGQLQRHVVLTAGEEHRG